MAEREYEGFAKILNRNFFSPYKREVAGSSPAIPTN